MTEVFEEVWKGCEVFTLSSHTNFPHSFFSSLLFVQLGLGGLELVLVP